MKENTYAGDNVTKLSYYLLIRTDLINKLNVIWLLNITVIVKILTEKKQSSYLKVLLGSLFRQTTLLTYYNRRQNLVFMTEVRSQQ